MRRWIGCISTSLALVSSTMAEEKRELKNRLEIPVVSMSAVKDVKSREFELQVFMGSQKNVLESYKIVGKDAASFRVVDLPSLNDEGEGVLKIAFDPQNGAGRYRAILQIQKEWGTSQVALKGIGLDVFEGKNEPPLQQIVETLGIPLKVGGETLSLNSEKATIGESVDVSYFRVVEGKTFQVRPLARFSPPGEVPIGLIFEDSKAKKEIGRLMASTPEVPDAHQCVFPRFADGKTSIEVTPEKENFGFYMDGHHFVSFTDPARQENAQVKRTARVYPVKEFGARVMKNTWMVCFEEAKNGDYQDNVFLIENVEPIRE